MRSEHQALLRLYAAESSLARAAGELGRLEARSEALAAREADARRLAGIVRRSLETSQGRVATLLRSLYVDGEVDPIAVILGAGSLDEAVTGIDSLSRAVAQNERLVVEARSRARSLERLRSELVARRRELDTARAQARSAAAAMTGAVAQRRALVASIRRQTDLTASRLSVLEARARAAQRQSVRLSVAAASGNAAPTAAAAEAEAVAQPVAAVQVPDGTSTLVVDAVAYHLPGRTASGLPVGIGVIAVDPAVIPLGTRVLVPGYGPAVAADVGSAIRGAVIDLWMPTTARANQWGRRTVTITVYR